MNYRLIAPAADGSLVEIAETHLQAVADRIKATHESHGFTVSVEIVHN